MKNYRYCEERIIDDLKKILNRYRKEEKNLAEQKISVEYKGVEYTSYEEIQEMFGCGEISMNVFDHLAKELKDKKENGTLKHIKENLENSEDRVSEIISELVRSLKSKEEGKLKETTRAERTKEATEFFVAYRKMEQKYGEINHSKQ